MSGAAAAMEGPREALPAVIARLLRRGGWALGLLGLLAVLLLYTKLIHPKYGAFDLQSLASGTLPLALAAAAQALIVIAGGIDLSVGSVMALANVTAAVLMAQIGDPASAGVVVLVLALGLLVGFVNGGLVVLTRVPDIVVTLATSFVWAGAALLILDSPGGKAAAWFRALAEGDVLVEWIPRALIVLLVTVGVVWIPLRRSHLGLSMYALGSDRLAAFRSGVNVSRTKVVAYAIGGLLAAAGGLALTMTTGIGTPTTGSYTLSAVAAVVLGGVSLAGGRGGLLGPVVAAFALTIIRVDLIFAGIDPNYSVVIQGAIMVVVVMIGGFLTLRRHRQ